jgi:hypothetical protein
MELIYYDYDGDTGEYVFKLATDQVVDPGTMAWKFTYEGTEHIIRQDELSIAPNVCIELNLELTYTVGGVLQTLTFDEEVIIPPVTYATYLLDNLNPLRVTFEAYVSSLSTTSYEWLENGVPIGPVPGSKVLIHTFPSAGVKNMQLRTTCQYGLSGLTVFKTFDFTVNIPNANCDDPFNIYLYKKDCHKYIIKDDAAYTRKFILKDYKGNVIEERTLLSTDTLIPFETPEDSVYIAIIENVTFPNMPPKEFPVYDMCDTDRCYYDILKEIQCSEDCTECDPEQDAKNDELRKILNSITGLNYFVQRYVRFDLDANRGLRSIDEDRNDEIGRIDKMFSIMKEVLIDCGYCNFEETNCSTC